MSLPTAAQIAHIEQHLDLFHNHAGTDRTPAEYLTEYAYYKDGDIYERLCSDLGLAPIADEGEVPMTEQTEHTVEMDPVTKARLQLDMGMGDDGGPLEKDRRAELEAFLAAAEAGATPVPAGESAQQHRFIPPQSTEGLPDHGGHQVQTPVQTQAEPDLAALIQQQVQQAVAQLANSGGLPAQPQAISLDDVLKAIDPRDSDAALAMYQWLVDNGRFSLVGTLNGGGYLLHYTEPKGTSKAGYTPGATKGGRMVDEAVTKAQAAGGVARDVGLCGKCFSGVEKLADGTVVTEDGSAVCSAGGAHEFHG